MAKSWNGQILGLLYFGCATVRTLHGHSFISDRIVATYDTEFQKSSVTLCIETLSVGFPATRGIAPV
jgi:hypothetical protein